MWNRCVFPESSKLPDVILGLSGLPRCIPEFLGVPSGFLDVSKHFGASITSSKYSIIEMYVDQDTNLNSSKLLTIPVEDARKWASSVGSFLPVPGIYAKPKQRCGESSKSCDGI
jgi:hypothetical protein